MRTLTVVEFTDGNVEIIVSRPNDDPKSIEDVARLLAAHAIHKADEKEIEKGLKVVHVHNCKIDHSYIPQAGCTCKCGARHLGGGWV